MKVLVTSASRKIPLLHAINAQFTGDIVAGDADPNCLASYAWPAFWTTPPIDTSHPDNVVAAITKEGFTHIVPTRDGELEFFAQQRERLAAEGIACMVAPESAIATCNDKWAFAHALSGAGLPAIETSLTIDGIAQERLVVKERNGAGARRVRINCNAEEAAQSATRLREPVFQPFVPGREISIDAYRTRDGRILGLIPRSRDLVIGGESQVTTTLDPAPYADLVTAVLDALDLQGHCVVQVIDGPHGPQVIECNARLGGASTLALAAGLMSLAWFARESDGLDPADISFTPRPAGWQLVRVPQDVIRDPGL